MATTKAPIWLLVLITLSGTLAMHLFVPALPDAGRDFGASTAVMQTTISAYIVGLAVGQLIYGPLSDGMGRRPMLMVGLAIYTSAGVVAALSTSVQALIVARLFQALGGCAGLALGRAIVRDTARPDEAVRERPRLVEFHEHGGAGSGAHGRIGSDGRVRLAFHLRLGGHNGRHHAPAHMASAAADQSADREHQGRGHRGRLPATAALAIVHGFRVGRGLCDDLDLSVSLRGTVRHSVAIAPTAA